MRCHWYEIVTPVSPSGSLTVAVSVWSSAVVPLSDTEPMLFTLATVTVNDWVTAVVPSVAERTTAFAPTSSLSGVPVNAPEAQSIAKFVNPPLFVIEYVIVSLPSREVATMLLLFAAPKVNVSYVAYVVPLILF